MRLSLFPDPLQQHRRRFILPAFASSQFSFNRDEFSTEGSGKDGLGQLVGPCRCGSHAMFDSVRSAEKNLDTTNNLVLFCSWRKSDLQHPDIADVDASYSNPFHCRFEALLDTRAAEK